MAATTFKSSTRLARTLLPHILPPICFTARWINIGESGSNEVDDVKKPKSVSVFDAFHLLQSGHRYLDVRTCDEFTGGHPIGALNIPYMLKLGSEMSRNPKFLEEVSSHFRKNDGIVIGCRSGVRSLKAATDLQASDFSRVVDVVGGFSAWIQNGLPSAN